MAEIDYPSLHALYLRYGCCMAYIAVEKDGNENIGSAFHVGDGVFVTARHVIDGRKIKEMRVSDANLFYKSDLYPKEPGGSYRITKDSPRMCDNVDGRVEVVGRPLLHPNPNVDIAAVAFLE